MNALGHPQTTPPEGALFIAEALNPDQTPSEDHFHFLNGACLLGVPEKPRLRGFHSRDPGRPVSTTAISPDVSLWSLTARTSGRKSSPPGFDHGP